MKTDTELQRDVMTELKWEPGIQAAEIGVGVKDGIVTLSGTVESHSKKWAAKRVAGVKTVEEGIKVSPPAAYRRTNEDITQSAKNMLNWNSLIPRDRVKVMVQNGWVTLSGDVDYYYQVVAADDTVRNLIGLWESPMG